MERNIKEYKWNQEKIVFMYILKSVFALIRLSSRGMVILSMLMQTHTFEIMIVNITIVNITTA